MNKVNIYVLIDPIDEQIKYIGKTIYPLKFRLQKHIGVSHKRTSIKDCWITSLLKINLEPRIELLDSVNNNEWEFWEKYWISQFKTWGFNLKNGTEGGDGTGKSFRHTLESRNKISLKLQGINHPQYGKSPTEITKEKISKANKNKISKFKNKTYEEIYGLNKSLNLKKQKHKSIFQFDLNQKLIKEWNSAKEIEDNLQIKRANICHCLKNRRNMAGGFLWKYSQK